jgi:large subunit ribosomal protein L9
LEREGKGTFKHQSITQFVVIRNFPCPGLTSPGKTTFFAPLVSGLRTREAWHSAAGRRLDRRPSSPATIMPTVEVILKQQIKELGAEADIVKVKAGYARNFLVPNGMALEATAGNRNSLKALKARRAEREAKELTEAETVASKLKKVTLKLTLKTGADGKAFGSVTALDVARALAEQGPKGLNLDRHAIHLEKSIKQTGKFEVPVRLHPQVTTSLKVHVAAESDQGAETAEDKTG